MTVQLSEPGREIVGEIVAFVRNGMRTEGLDAREAREARWLVWGVGSYLDQARRERWWEQAGHASFADALRAEFQVELGDALKVIRAAKRLRSLDGAR